MSRIFGRWFQSRGDAGAPRVDTDPRPPDDPARLAEELVRLYESGQYREAEGVARRLVDVQRVAVGTAHPDFGTAVSNLGLLLQKQGRQDEAEPLLREALEVRRSTLGEDHPHFASSLNHLAELLQHRGDLAGAEPLLRQALEIRRAALGEGHPDYATGLTSLALLLHRQRDLAGAEPLLRQALEIRRAALGDRHPHYATALANLAMVLQERRRLDEAGPLLRQALEIRRAALGDRHPDYALSLALLAHLESERGEPAAAESLLAESVRLRVALLGEDHPDVRADASILASLRARLRPTVSAPPTAPVPQPPVATPAHEAPAAKGPTLRADEPETGLLGRAARGPIVAPTVAPTPPPRVEPPAAAAPVSTRGFREIADAAIALQATLERVSRQLRESADRMDEEGVPPDSSLIAEANGCRDRVDALRVEAIRAFGERQVSVDRPAEALPGLKSIIEWLDVGISVEEERAEQRRRLAEALAVLQRVRALTHGAGADDASMLRPALAAAESLAGVLLTPSAEIEHVDVVVGLASGSHPLCLLLRLVDGDPTLADRDWARLYKTVGATFGRPVAAAAARGRITRRGPETSPARIASPPTPFPTPASGLSPREPSEVVPAPREAAPTTTLGAATPQRPEPEPQSPPPLPSNERGAGGRAPAERPSYRMTLADLTDAVFEDAGSLGRNGRGHGPLWISLDGHGGKGTPHPRFPARIQWRMN